VFQRWSFVCQLPNEKTTKKTPRKRAREIQRREEREEREEKDEVSDPVKNIPAFCDTRL
jgi:hypothetical protein